MYSFHIVSVSHRRSSSRNLSSYRVVFFSFSRDLIFVTISFLSCSISGLVFPFSSLFVFVPIGKFVEFVIVSSRAVQCGCNVFSISSIAFLPLSLFPSAIESSCVFSLSWSMSKFMCFCSILVFSRDFSLLLISIQMMLCWLARFVFSALWLLSSLSRFSRFANHYIAKLFVYFSISACPGY